MTAPASTSALLPARWPWLSLTCLKPSRSRNSSDSGRPLRDRALGLAAQHLVQVPRVGQPRQVVGDRQRLGLLERERVVERDGRRLEDAAQRQQQRRRRATGAVADGCGSSRPARRSPAPRQMSGNAIAVPLPRPPLRGSLLKSPREQLGAVAHHPVGRGPQRRTESGVQARCRPSRSAGRCCRGRRPPSTARGSSSWPGARATRRPWPGRAWRWLRGPPRTSASRVARRARRVRSRAFQRAAGSGRRAPRTIRGVPAALRPPDLTARCDGRAGTWMRRRAAKSFSTC